MPHGRRQPAGFSLIELLIVVAVMGILAALVMPGSTANYYEQLRAAAQIFRTDLAYGRSLAVSNNSSYQFTFDPEQNRYVLEHNGTNPALNTLPDTPFRQPDDPADQHVVNLAQLPHMGPTVRLMVAAADSGTPTRVDDLEFGPLGETTRSQPTVIWLAVGQGTDTRYLTVTVDPVTGLAEFGAYTNIGPPSGLLAGLPGG